MSQTVLITGAGGAIAAAAADVFQQAGWRLVLIARRAEPAASLRTRYPESLVLQADLSDEAEAARAIGEAGTPDALLNIAGGFALQSALNMRQEDLAEQLARNLYTAVNATRAVLPGMVARGSGFILGVAAAAALQGGAKQGAYAAAKAALVAYLKSLQRELAPQGVHVSILYPMGAVDTPANRAAMPTSDPKRWIDARGLAEAMLFLATRPRRGTIHELHVHAPS